MNMLAKRYRKTMNCNLNKKKKTLKNYEKTCFSAFSVNLFTPFFKTFLIFL